MARKKPRLIFEPTADGFVINLRDDERELIARLIGELRELLLANDPLSEPLLRRLFPPAYHLADDAEADAEYQRLMREELVASRLAAIEEADRLLNSGKAAYGFDLAGGTKDDRAYTVIPGATTGSTPGG